MPLTNLELEHLSPKSYEFVSTTEPLWLHENMTKYGVILACKRDTDTYIHIHTHTYIYTYLCIQYIWYKQIHTHTYTYVLAPGGVVDTGIASYIDNIHANTWTYRHIHTYYMHIQTTPTSYRHIHANWWCNIVTIQAYITAVFTYKILCIEKQACIMLV